VYGSLFRFKMAAPSLGIPNREQTSWSANANTYIKLIDNLRVNAFFYYYPSRLTLQGSSAAWYQLGIGANYSMLDDKLSFRLNLRNLIIPENPEYITFGNNFYSRSYSN
jgi:hypothetical protein